MQSHSRARLIALTAKSSCFTVINREGVLVFTLLSYASRLVGNSWVSRPMASVFSISTLYLSPRRRNAATTSNTTGLRGTVVYLRDNCSDDIGQLEWTLNGKHTFSLTVLAKYRSNLLQYQIPGLQDILLQSPSDPSRVVGSRTYL